MKIREVQKNIGRHLMIGVSSLDLLPKEKEFIKTFEPAGIILFKRNYRDLEQLVSLVNEIKALIKDPLIGVDQEGGNVIRFGKPFTQFPELMALGKYFEATGSLEAAVKYADILSSELNACGVNLCFTPVMDILTNKNNSVIGTRAFSCNGEIVSKVGKAIIEKLNEKKLISCAKHFPGHGDTEIDSHLDLPEIDHDLNFLRKRELVPFKAAIDANVPMIMTAHIKYKSLDCENTATLSKTINKDILRDEMNFKGVLITDDLDMKAITKTYGKDESILKAFYAGADIVLACHGIEDIMKNESLYVDHFENDKNFAKSLNISYERILKLKSDFQISSKPAAYKTASKAIDDSESKEFFEMLA